MNRKGFSKSDKSKFINLLEIQIMKSKAYNFRKSITISLIVISMFIAYPKQSKAQDQVPTLYALVEYMKVKQADVEKYLELERTFWKPIHEERVKKKEIAGWRIFAVRYTGTGDEYNFVTGTFFDDLSKLEKVFNVDVEKIHPGKDIQKTYQETLESRELVKRNLLVMNSTINSTVPYKYLQVNFMKVKQGEENAYINVENSVWKPVHEELAKTGSKSGWSVWSIIYPGGYGTEYQYLTVDDFSEFTQIKMAGYESAFGKVHAGKNPAELMDQTNKSRILVRSELWESLDSVWGE
jgi:L-rhamnose mutarotase